MRGRRLAALFMLLVAAAGFALIARPYVNGLSFVIRATEMHGAIRTLADAGTWRTIERQIDIDVPTGAHGKMPGRLYAGAPALSPSMSPKPTAPVFFFTARTTM